MLSGTTAAPSGRTAGEPGAPDAGERPFAGTGLVASVLRRGAARRNIASSRVRPVSSATHGAMAIVASSCRSGTVIDMACTVSAVATAPITTRTASQAKARSAPRNVTAAAQATTSTASKSRG